VPELADGIQFNVADFKEMIQQVAFSASSDDARPVLTGVLITGSGSEISMAATDGFRVSVSKTQLPSPLPRPVSAIVPARTLSELARIATEGDQPITMIIPAGRGQVIFHMKDIELVSQLIEGNFPDFKAISPLLQNPLGYLNPCHTGSL